MKKVGMSLFVLSIICSFFCACYTSTTSLAPIRSTNADAFSEVQHSVTVRAYAFTPSDSSRYFGHNVFVNSYQPIQFTIKNSSNKYLVFSSKNIDLPFIEPRTVADTVRLYLKERNIAEPREFFNQEYLLKNDYDHTIAPFTTFNTVVFVALNRYKPVFTLNLIDRDTNDKFVYQIDIRKPNPTYERAKQAASDTVDKAKKVATDTVDKVKETAKNVTDKIRQKI